MRAAQAYVRHGAAGAISCQARLACDLARPIGVAGMIRAGAERPSAARAGVAIARHVPALIELVARLTRINHSHLDHRRTWRES